MRVLIHTRAATGQRTGIGHYTGELIRALRARAGDPVREFPTRWEARTAAWYAGQSERYEAADPRSWGRAARGRMLAVARKLGVCAYTDQLARAARRERIELAHEPCFIPLDCGVPAIATVHDLSVLLHPEWHKPETVALFEAHFADGLKRCRHLLTLTEFGKSEIVKHLGWPADRVSVAYMGVRAGLKRVAGDERARGLKTLGLSPGYLLHVGTLEPRKNLTTAIRAYAALPGALREKHPLVLVGGKGWRSEGTHEYLRTEGKAHNIRWLGYVDEPLFPALYSGARALVFPTFYEGFGMPTIEMMACGGAVLASTAGAVAETVGAHAHLIEPTDEHGWHHAIRRALTDDDWITQLRTGAEAAAKPFTWENCAQQTLNAYRLALGQGRARTESEVKRAA